MNRRIRRLGVGLVALIGLLFLQVSYIQVFAAGRIAADPANARRQIIAEYKVERGQIITADGTVIALSEPTGANASLRYVRRYPEGPLFAGITGFYSQVYGRTELEQSMNTYLAGDAPELAVSTLADLVLGRPEEGRARHHHDQRAPATRGGRARSAPSPGRSWRWIRATATSWRWSRTRRSIRTSCRRRTSRRSAPRGND